MNAAMIMMVEKSVLGLDQIRVDAGGSLPKRWLVDLESPLLHIRLPLAEVRVDGAQSSE